MRDKILILLSFIVSFSVTYSIPYLYYDIFAKEESIMEHLVEEDFGVDDEGEWILI